MGERPPPATDATHLEPDHWIAQNVPGPHLAVATALRDAARRRTQRDKRLPAACERLNRFHTAGHDHTDSPVDAEHLADVIGQYRHPPTPCPIDYVG